MAASACKGALKGMEPAATKEPLMGKRAGQDCWGCRFGDGIGGTGKVGKESSERVH